jgi:hypothetical protein
MRFGQTTGRSHRQQALVPDRALTFALPGRQAISAELAKYDVGVEFHYYEAAAPHRGRLIAEGEGEHAPDADSGAHS